MPLLFSTLLFPLSQVCKYSELLLMRCSIIFHKIYPKLSLYLFGRTGFVRNSCAIPYRSALQSKGGGRVSFRDTFAPENHTNPNYHHCDLQICQISNHCIVGGTYSKMSTTADRWHWWYMWIRAVLTRLRRERLKWHVEFQNDEGFDKEPKPRSSLLTIRVLNGNRHQQCKWNSRIS